MWGIFLYLKFPFLSLLWIDVPYPLRPCSSATRSLKFFLFSFPDVISSLIFSVPQSFTPILLQHRHCFPVRFLSAFPVQPSIFLGRWFVSDSLQVFLGCYCKFSELVFELGWAVDFLEVFFSICTLSSTFLWCQHRRAVENHLISGPSLCPLLLLPQKVSMWSLWLISHVCPLRSKTAALTDDRIRTMSEFISGIKSVKMNAWEKSLIDLITRLRR